MNSFVFDQVAETVRREIEGHLRSVGLLCRVFGRGKAAVSLKQKLSQTPDKYKIGGRLIQDVVGIRVVLYFPEDVEIVQSLLSARYEWERSSSAIDLPADATFSVTRHNLIFRLPSRLQEDVRRAVGALPVDSTFEVQLRTVLSEGWHEVEHDLRYKSPDHWQGQDDLSRALNGVVATLETAEWAMGKLFAELSYRQYRKRNWAAMLHTKLRMRVQPVLSAGIAEILDSDPESAKKFHRINRKKIIELLADLERAVPVNLDNIVQLWNAVAVRNPAIRAIAPAYLLEVFESDLGLVFSKESCLESQSD